MESTSLHEDMAVAVVSSPREAKRQQRSNMVRLPTGSRHLHAALRAHGVPLIDADDSAWKLFSDHSNPLVAVDAAPIPTATAFNGITLYQWKSLQAATSASLS